MRHSQTLDSILLVVAVLLMLVSLFNENVTLATGDYRRALLTALVTMAIADLICLQDFLRRHRARWVAVLIALPSLFILWDFVARAPSVWRTH
jgi:hypothetical protein